MNKQIEALLVERAGYEKRGLKDRVKAVDAALRELDFDHKYMVETEIETASFEPVVERAIVKAAKKRKG
jgi:heme-binding NEAT domain protein